MHTHHTVILTLSTLSLLSTGCSSGADVGRPSFGTFDEPGFTETTDTDPASNGSDGDSGSMESTGATDSASDSSEAIDEFILGLPHFALPEQVPPMQKQCEKDCLEDTAKCVYTYYGATDHFSEFVAFEPNSATLWPGAITQGKDAQFGLLTPVGLPRAPMTFSVSLANLQGSPVGTMDVPKLSSYRDVLLSILGQGLSGETPASLSFSVEQVNSSDSLSRLLKTDVSWGKDNGKKITGLFDFKDESSQYKLAVDFVQAYYTVDIDTPTQPSELFQPGVTLDEVQTFMDVENPPMVVQSITYGRRAVLAIESTHDLTEVKTAFSAAIKAVVDVNVSVDTHAKEVLDNLDVKAFVLGGSGDDAIKVVSGFEGLMAFLKDDATYSANSPGAPIAYKLTYLDNTGAKFALTTEFAEAACSQDMQLMVTGLGLYVETNGEGKGNAELSYVANVDVDGSSCEFVNVSSVHQPDGKDLPFDVTCPFTLSPEAPHTMTLALWTKEAGDGLFDKTKEASNSVKYTYDPATRQWTPLITGQDGVLTASNGNSGETLSLNLRYTISIL